MKYVIGCIMFVIGFIAFICLGGAESPNVCYNLIAALVSGAMMYLGMKMVGGFDW
jgi:hypothetical protein